MSRHRDRYVAEARWPFQREPAGDLDCVAEMLRQRHRLRRWRRRVPNRVHAPLRHDGRQIVGDGERSEGALLRRHAAPQHDAQQLARAGGEPRPIEIDPESAAAARADVPRAFGLVGPAEGRQHIQHLGRRRARGVEDVERQGRGVAGEVAGRPRQAVGKILAEARGRRGDIRDAAIFGVVKFMDAVDLLRDRGAVDRSLEGAGLRRRRLRLRAGAAVVDGLDPARIDVEPDRALAAQRDVVGQPRLGAAEHARGSQILELRLDQRLLHRVHQGQDPRRRQHPVPAIVGQLLQHREIGRASFQDPAPDRQLRQRVGGGIAAQHHRDLVRLGDPHGQEALLRRLRQHRRAGAFRQHDAERPLVRPCPGEGNGEDRTRCYAGKVDERGAGRERIR